ncbi:6985_t:CDS:2 [Ambispora leptoticha]|uniref:6985_t:CDS:1 n=1 Tax=Ambispora leptoticha TaxID=144679 RepID=A0A9N8ZLF7_9GLOM|nr:6985_t:CDS:2 [Ambispora leptoticha]
MGHKAISALAFLTWVTLYQIGGATSVSDSGMQRHAIKCGYLET